VTEVIAHPWDWVAKTVVSILGSFSPYISFSVSLSEGSIKEELTGGETKASGENPCRKCCMACRKCCLLPPDSSLERMTAPMHRCMKIS
jgi:hypothetical protein